MTSDIDKLYSSTPLNNNQIRIIYLKPGTNFASDIDCSLEAISLNAGNGQTKTPTKEYRALSYVWGEESNKKPIFVNGVKLTVTSNLELALRRLRAHHSHDHANSNKYLTLWVDAVCINQADDIERGDQVALMGKIYQFCSEVCVWLGPIGCDDIPTCLTWDNLTSPPSIDHSLSPSQTAIVTGLEQCARNIATLATAPPQLHIKDLPPHSTSPTHLTHSMISAITQLSTTPWFTRAWVVQEAHLAPNTLIYFGNIVLPRDKLWDAFVTRKRLIETCSCCERGEDPASPDLKKSTDNFFGNLAHLGVIRDPVGVLGKGEVPTDPYMAILEFSIRRRGQNCKDPRDRVYAYLGVVESWLGQGVSVGVVPDYTLSGTETVESKAAELYLRVCCDAVDKGKSLEFLAWDTRKNLEFNKGDPLPSWVLDWTHFWGRGESTHLFDCRRWDSAKAISFKAEVVESMDVRDVVTGNKGRVRSVLATTGRRIDRIAKVGLQFQTLSEDVCLNWHSVTGLREKDAGDKPYPSGGTWGDAWWKALCFVTENSQIEWKEKDIRGLEFVNAIVSNQHYNYLPKMKVSKACSEALPVRELVSSQPAMAALWKESITPIQQAMNMRLDGKVLVLTEKGYLGFARTGVQEGDAMFLLGGCRAPLLLREAGKVVDGRVVFNGGKGDLNGKILYELMSSAFIYGIMDGELETTGTDDLPVLETVCIA